MNDQKINYSLHRTRFLDWVKTALTGPGKDSPTNSGKYTIHKTCPVDLFPTGILFPISADSGIDPSTETEENDDYSLDIEGEPEKSIHATKPRYVAPSSIGLSLFVSSDAELYLEPWAVHYHQTSKSPRKWERVPFQSYDDSDPLNFISPTTGSVSEREIWEGRAKLYTLWRPHCSGAHKGYIVTISIANLQQQLNSGKLREINDSQSEKALFEVELRCEIMQGSVFPYPRKPLSLMDEEEQELELQYTHQKNYAIGHGVAVDWSEDSGSVTELRTQFMPRLEVPTVTPQISDIDNDVLSLEWLATSGENKELLLSRLHDFVAAYKVWQQREQKKTANFSPDEKIVSERIFDRITIASKRMHGGITLLQSSPDVLDAFTLANRAMLMQMKRSEDIDRTDRDQYRWRPFQLAFLLLTLESVADRDNEFRDTVDLIWFPTGGGKTEAYLGVIAFQILYRRITNSSSSGGTNVIMRYTLRLLTQQQFERASKLICALELLRKKHPYLGSEPITAGMWVGASTSPNQFTNSHNGTGALEILNKASGVVPPHKLVITKCPWCDEPIWRSEQDHGYTATENRFSIRCINKKCLFNNTLPLNVVDEALYQKPPTLLFATVDKFATFAWDERTSVFFGSNSGDRNLPPELIIQDELHLISGALGSIVGLYEAGIDSVLINNGAHPKYIASTATIRNAKQQIKGLYGKEHATFPPPGLSADDSFFTRTIPVEEKPGRVYLGYLASQMQKSDAFSTLTAALLIAPIVLFAEDKRQREELMDCWWSLLIYHGSLRGVGESQNALQFQIANRIQQYLEREYGEESQSNNWIDKIYRPMIRSHALQDRLNQVTSAQLTSKKSVEENAATFSRLEKTEREQGALDVALATNMISVGLDVGRLALMIINGQPLTTAEYIQSSSRVGRSEVPGIIVANYYRHQARSLSHYEDFRSYHQSFYRYVEPTSVTPYTRQARKRALHAALVIVLRHSRNLGLLTNDSAINFDRHNHSIQKAVETLSRRCRSAISDVVLHEATLCNLNELIEEWEELVGRCNNERERLVYRGDSSNKSGARLLYGNNDKIIGHWLTLNSMRNVEDNALSVSSGLFDPPNCRSTDL